MPAVRAAFLQCLALVPTLGLSYLATLWHHPLPVYAVALLQGGFAAILTWVARLDAWWRPMQLVFPIALAGAVGLHVPSRVLVAPALIMVLLFWSTFRTRVPFFPSGRAVQRALAGVLPPGPVRLIDIGSGLGGLVLQLARQRSDSHMSGIELAPLPWLVSAVRAELTCSSARFVRGDYERLDFGEYDVVFAYLSPAAMGALWRKARDEMRPGTMLVSYEFTIPGQSPSEIVATGPDRPDLFVWYL